MLPGPRDRQPALPLESDAGGVCLDLVFRSAETLKPLYEQLARQAVLSVKAEHVASFLGKKITPQLAQEIGSRFETRIEGTCIKHRLGKA